MSTQRVDAARNRKRVLDAAVHEHARHGSALGMQDVARRAGVGTVYRHFPSRQATNEATPAIWQRHVELLLDGLRGQPPGELPLPPIDRALWDRFVHSTRVTVEHDP